MKIIVATITLISLMSNIALAQSSKPLGCYMQGPNQKSAYFHREGTYWFVPISYYPIDSSISGEFLCFEEEQLEVLTNSSSYDPVENVYLGGGVINKYQASFPPMARGIQVFLTENLNYWSRYFEIRSDTLWIRPLTSGVLPVDFRKGSATMTDTLGLQRLLPAIANSFGKAENGRAIKLSISDPECHEGSPRQERLRERRWAVLSAALKQGLGTAFSNVKVEFLACDKMEKRFTAAYQFE